MAIQTTRNDGDVDLFLGSIGNERRREDCRSVVEMMREITGEEPAMWGPSIVGFGSYHYRYKSGHEGDFFHVGVSPRKQSLSLYIMPGFDEYSGLLERLGKHKTGKACLYINKLDDVDTDVLRELIRKAVTYMRETT